MSNDNTFGALRSLCQLPASRLAYIQIMELLVDAEQRKEPLLEQELLPYALAHIERWPSSLCRVAGPFASELIRTDALSCHAIKALDLSGFDLREAGIDTLLEATNLTNLLALDISGTSIGFRELSALCEHPRVHRGDALGKLEELSFRENECERHFLFMMLRAPWMRSVHTLDWNNNNLPHGRYDTLRDMLDGIEPLPLRTLHLTRSPMYDEDIELLCGSRVLPHLEHLSLTVNSPHDTWFSALDANAGTRTITSLSLMTYLDTHVDALLESTFAADLRRLDLHTVMNMTPLYEATRAQLPSLEHLHVHASNSNPDTRQLNPERAGDLLSGLEHLRITGWRHPRDTLESWIDPETLAPGLRTLHIRDAPLGDQLASSLSLHFSEAQQLEELSLHHCELGADFAHTLCQLDPIETLRELDLGGNPIGDEPLSKLLALPHIDALKSLSLSATELGALSMLALQTHSTASLTHLDLSYNDLSMEAISTLLDSPKFAGLIDLELSHMGLDDDSLIALNQSRFARTLERLDISGNALTDRGLRTFLRLFEFDALELLDLSQNDLTIRGLTTLSRAYKLSRVRELRIAVKSGTQGAVVSPGDRKLYTTSVYTALLSSAALRHLHELDWSDMERRHMTEETRRWRSL